MGILQHLARHILLERSKNDDKEYLIFVKKMALKIRLFLNIAILLAAAGITTLEFAEASAVGLALYADSKKHAAFLYVALGILVVMIPTFLVGGLIGLLPDAFVNLIGGVLLLYFGLRLVKSARRSVVKSRTTGFTHHEEFEKGVMATGFSVGAIEAFEAAIVLVGLLPKDYVSSEIGIALGVAVVVGSTYLLRNHVRKVKQANMKELVSALLLSFSVFWFGEIFFVLNDAYLIPIFIAFFLLVRWIANRPVPKLSQATTEGSPKQIGTESSDIHK
jgi:uncharacterized membrane protein